MLELLVDRSELGEPLGDGVAVGRPAIAGEARSPSRYRRASGDTDGVGATVCLGVVTCTWVDGSAAEL
ncbi:hypothetical protein [Fodinicola feengrottensis]|uniref:hypothetical protein n=1 Tax=Fodinicola feengrottensis TaxID=435914 RepID=UPI0024415CBE|nr:hypothetical protein [Fodinicola feengrottensis]